MPKPLLKIHAKDNVAVALMRLQRGDIVETNHDKIKVIDEIPLYHKIAVSDIHVGQNILKYGSVIGSATREIKAGEHVHTHNVESGYD